MKFKKAFAWILAVATVISLMPSMAFAATTNSVVKTSTVPANEIMPIVAIDMKVTDRDGLEANKPQKFGISFENAVWSVENPKDDNIVDNNGKLEGEYSSSPSGNYGVAMVTTTTGALVASNVSEDSATLTFTPNTTIPKDEYVRLYLSLKSGGEINPVEVTIEQMDSSISGGTFTVANVLGSDTITTVTGKVRTYPRQEISDGEAKIQIRETAGSSISGNQTIKLTLPKDCTWLESTEISGDLTIYNSNATTLGGMILKGNITDVKGKAGSYYIENSRTLYVNVPVSPNFNDRQDIIITPRYSIGKNTPMGDITVSVTGISASTGNQVSTENDLVIAVYGDESVTITTVDDIPEVVSGFVKDTGDNLFTVQVTLEENTAKALTRGRYIDFDFNDEVQIVTNEAIKYYVGSSSVKYNGSGVKILYKAGEDSVNIKELVDFAANTAKDCSEFSMKVPSEGDLTNWSDIKTNRLTLLIPITVKANYEGDVTLTVKGAKAGIDDTDVVVATAIPVFSVDTEVTDIINGAQGQAAANITITENAPGYTKEINKHITLSMDTAGLDPDSFAFDSAKAEVTSGNMDIKDKVGTSDGQLSITVSDPSTVASTIEITDVVINMARNLPEGQYKVKASMDTIENDMYNDKDFKKTIASAVYVNNTTVANDPDGSSTKGKTVSTFTLKSNEYTVNGETYEMDAAAYLDENNRTMVPVRYAALACGVPESDIVWYQGMQLAKINGPQNVVTATIGSNILQCTTMNDIVMDTVVVSDSGRLYVPIRYIANALNFDVDWDQETKTATFTSR